MKITRTIISSFIMYSFLMVSCTKSEMLATSGETEQDDEYLIFGTYYGFFVGEGVDTYKLTKNALYTDINNSWDINKAKFTRLSDAEFNLVKNLIQAIPSELIMLNDSTFGCPDCADQGGINIEYSKNGIVKQWKLDQYNTHNPEFLHEFRDQVNEKIQVLNPQHYENSASTNK